MAAKLVSMVTAMSLAGTGERNPAGLPPPEHVRRPGGASGHETAAGANWPAAREGDVTMPAAIETSGLCKTYGPVRAVTGLNLAVEPGQIFAFLGPNGAGKPVTGL